MKPLVNAAVGIAKCQNNGKIYGVLLEEHGKKWNAKWAFKISEKVAQKEGFNEQSFPDNVKYMKEYPGCPYCNKLEKLKTGNVERYISVYMAVDISGSMSGTPLKEAKKAMINFVEQFNEKYVKIGIITFESSLSHVLPLTNDYNAVKKAINSLSVSGGTSAIPFDMARNAFDRKGLRNIIVLTDGQWSYQSQAIADAQKCHKEEIEVFALGFGSVDKSFLDAIASSKEYSKLTTLDNLSDAFTGFAGDIGGTR